MDQTLYNNGGRGSETDRTSEETQRDGVEEDMKRFDMAREVHRFKHVKEENEPFLTAEPTT